MANESDLELHFSLNWEGKQFKFIFQEKEDFGKLSYFTALYRSVNYSPSYNGIKDENRNEIDVEDVESMDLVASPESNSSYLVV